MSNINDNELIDNELNDNELIEDVICNKKNNYTEAQKRAIYKWRVNNRDKVKIWNENNKELIKNSNQRWINDNRDILKEKWKIYSQKTRDYKHECKRLCNILVF
jgi:hypothetical protein